MGGASFAAADPSSRDADTFIAKTVQSANIDLGDHGFSLGDEFVFSDDLFAKNDDNHRSDNHDDAVGTDGGVCTIVRVADAGAEHGTAQCVVTLSLTDRGQITIQGLVDVTGGNTPASFDLAITGGTGDFADAGGTVTVEQVNDDREKITLHVQHLS
jgi:hypothetical protein